MNIHTPFVILSAERAALSDAENARRTDTLRARLKHGFDFAEVGGVYQGKREHSFLVLAPVIFWRDTLISLAFIWEQESVLVVDANRLATLHYQDGRTEQLGPWRELPKHEALHHDAFTEHDGRYYIAG